MSLEEIREIGQSDFEITVSDYRIAKISWQFFLRATGGLSDDKSPLVDAINEAYLARPTNYLLNLCIYDSMLAICRLTDDRGRGERVTLLRIKKHLVEKRAQLSADPGKNLEDIKQIETAISDIKELRKSEACKKIRERRNKHLAHRLAQPELAELTNGELNDILANLDALFCHLAPLFHATKGFPKYPVEQHDFHTQKFWKAVELGAPQTKSAQISNKKLQ